MAEKRIKPLPRSQRRDFTGNIRFAGLPDKENRARQVRRGDDAEQNVAITLKDIDGAIQYYFNNVLSPTVVENGQIVKVPIKYGNPERWSAVQKDGFIRDEKGKIIAPVIMWRRTNVSKNTDIPVDKIDRNVYYQFEKQFTERNRYDNFSVLINKIPTRERYNVVIPDYVLVSYECVAWTSFVEQMNKILELLQYSEGAYWGDPERFKFYTSIENFDQVIENSTDAERTVRMNFTLDLKGYLIPESYNNLVNTQKQYTTQQVVLTNETEVDILSVFQPDSRAEKVFITTQKGTGGVRTVNEIVVDNSLLEEFKTTYIDYLRKRKVYSSFVVSGSTINSDNGVGQAVVTFPNVITASAPADFDPTNKQDFLIFINGQFIETDALEVTQSSTSFIVGFLTSSIGYSISSSDEIVVSGKFDGDDEPNTNIETLGGFKNVYLTYFRKSFVHSNFTVTASTVTESDGSGQSIVNFPNIFTASAPSDLTATSENDFLLFTNGAYMEHDALTIAQSGSVFVVTVDTGSMGYSISGSDEIVVHGKFNS